MDTVDVPLIEVSSSSRKLVVPNIVPVPTSSFASASSTKLTRRRRAEAARGSGYLGWIVLVLALGAALLWLAQ